MFYVYVLKSDKDQKFYIGLTGDLKNRVVQHNNGEVIATKSRQPLSLIFYEAFVSKEKAIKREKYLKTQKGQFALTKMLR